MRFSAILATAAFITPAVLAASSGHSGASHSGSKSDNYGLEKEHLDVTHGMHKARDIELGHFQARNDKVFAEELPGYTDGKDDGLMQPTPDSRRKAQEKSDGLDNADKMEEPTPTESNGDELDPSGYNSGEEASFPLSRSYLRSRALNVRQDDDGDDDGDDDASYACEQGKDGECGNDDDDASNGESESDNKYLARAKRAREDHIKSINAKRNAAGLKLKQASRKEVVERSRHARRTGSRASASPRPARA